MVKAREPLAEYNRKRSFSKTPESTGDREPCGKGLSFCVHKRAASRLCYDFRFAMDGVLKSLAMPKGPSINPSDRGLTVEVEEHPVAYGSLEGT